MIILHGRGRNCVQLTTDQTQTENVPEGPNCLSLTLVRRQSLVTQQLRASFKYVRRRMQLLEDSNRYTSVTFTAAAAVWMCGNKCLHLRTRNLASFCDAVILYYFIGRKLHLRYCYAHCHIMTATATTVRSICTNWYRTMKQKPYLYWR
jgi:hypothetical protein